MKKIIFSLILILGISTSQAQEMLGSISNQSVNWTTAVQNLNTSQITSGIL